MTSHENEQETDWRGDPDDQIPWGGRPEPRSVEDGDSEPEDEVATAKTSEELPPLDPEQAPMELGKPVNGPVNLDEAGANTLARNERHIRLWVADAIAEANKKGWVDPWIHETNQRARAYVDAMKKEGRLGDEAYKELCDEISKWYAALLGNIAVTDSEPDE